MLLITNRRNELFLDTLRFLLDANITTGISKKKIQAETGDLVILPAHDFSSLQLAFEFLKSHNTGSHYDVRVVQNFLSKIETPYRDFCRDILIKSYKCGVDVKTANKVYGCDFIPTIEIQLARKYFDDPAYVKGKSFTLTQKLDGVRGIIIKDKDSVTIYSRQGKIISGLEEIETFAKALNGSFVLDGELLATTSGTSAEIYKDTTSILLSDGIKAGIVFHAFDYLEMEEFLTKKCDTPYLERRQKLSNLIMFPGYIQLEPILYSGSDETKIMEYLQKARESNQEGIMININDANYKFGRTKDLLKVKVMQDVDLRITGFEEGDGAFAGTLGATVCDYKGNELRVGSGYTIEERNMIWENRNQLVGHVMCVQYFEETINKKGERSLRFPVFLKLCESGKEPSYN